MKIAVYSGSFDPLHIGHQSIMEHLTAESAFDWVYLVVSPQNPLKAANKSRSGEERYRAAVEAVKRHPELHVWVDDIELTMPPPHYTIRTLDALKAREPENDFTLVIGADNLDSIRRWRDFPRILSEYGVAVFPRKGFDVPRIRKELQRENLLSPAPYVLDSYSTRSMEGNLGFEGLREGGYKIRVLDMSLVDVSSTQIREALARNLDVSDLLM